MYRGGNNKFAFAATIIITNIYNNIIIIYILFFSNIFTTKKDL